MIADIFAKLRHDLFQLSYETNENSLLDIKLIDPILEKYCKELTILLEENKK